MGPVQHAKLPRITRSGYDQVPGDWFEGSQRFHPSHRLQRDHQDQRQQKIVSPNARSSHTRASYRKPARRKQCPINPVTPLKNNSCFTKAYQQPHVKHTSSNSRQPRDRAQRTIVPFSIPCPRRRSSAESVSDSSQGIEKPASTAVRKDASLYTPPESPLGSVEIPQAQKESPTKQGDDDCWSSTYQMFDYWVFYRIDAHKRHLQEYNHQRQQILNYLRVNEPICATLQQLKGGPETVRRQS